MEIISRTFVRGHKLKGLADVELMMFLPNILPTKTDTKLLVGWEEFFQQKGVPYIVERVVMLAKDKRRFWRYRLWKPVVVKKMVECCRGKVLMGRMRR
jgi:hypothetical protein